VNPWSGHQCKQEERYASMPASLPLGNALNAEVASG
jgi:hypothetical protein